MLGIPAPSVLVVAIMVVSPTLQAQQASDADQFAIQRAVARYVKASSATSTRGFDDAIKDFIAASDSAAIGHYPPDQAKVLAEDLEGVVIQFPNGACDLLLQTGCIELVARIAVPRIEGDSATVWLHTYDTRYNEMVSRELLVKRRGSTWAVVWVLQVHRARSG